MHGRAFGNPIVDAEASGGAAGQHTAARGAANGSGSVGIGEFHALGGELVEVRRLDDRVAEAGEVAIAEIVTEDDDDVLRLLRLGS